MYILHQVKRKIIRFFVLFLYLWVVNAEKKNEICLIFFLVGVTPLFFG
jgi:hypothetical protein